MRACKPYLPSQPTEGYTAGKVIPKAGLSNVFSRQNLAPPPSPPRPARLSREKDRNVLCPCSFRSGCRWNERFLPRSTDASIIYKRLKLSVFVAPSVVSDFFYRFPSQLYPFILLSFKVVDRHIAYSLQISRCRYLSKRFSSARTVTIQVKSPS